MARRYLIRAKPILSGIDDAAACMIAEELKTNTIATEIDLYGQQISDAGVLALAKALERNTTVTSLDLASNEIGTVGAMALLQVLRTRNHTLETLDLSGNDDVEDELLTEIANQLESNQMLLDDIFEPEPEPEPAFGPVVAHSALPAHARVPISVRRVLPARAWEDNEATLKSLDVHAIERLAEELVASAEAGGAAAAADPATAVHSLCLTSCTFNATAARALGAALWSAPALTSLTLVAPSGLGTDGFAQLAASLERLANLRSLRVKSPTAEVRSDRFGWLLMASDGF